MKYIQTTMQSGAWVKGSEITSGTRCKLVSEAKSQPSTFLDKNGVAKNQEVAKIRFENNPEPMNISINRASINALIDAFGEDSVSWIGKMLVAETEKVRVAGKAVTALYLIPEGYEKRDDENGYAVIVKKGESNRTSPSEDYPDGIDTEEIPF